MLLHDADVEGCVCSQEVFFVDSDEWADAAVVTSTSKATGVLGSSGMGHSSGK